MELNPGPVEAGKQLAVPVEGRREGGREGGRAKEHGSLFAITLSSSF